MGFGRRDEHDEENPVPDPEQEKLNQNPEPEMEMKKIPVKEYPVTVIPGHNEPLLKVHHLKYLLLGFNFLVTLLGVVLLSLSVWVYVDPEFWQYESTLKVDNLKTVLVMCIIASLVILIIGFLGCFGAVAERRWLLFLYIIVFGIVFLFELAALVLLWSAPYSNSIGRELEKQIQKQIDDRMEDDSARKFMDYVQEHLECCGSQSPRDYRLTEAPKSCMGSSTGTLHPTGCAAKMLTYIRGKAGIIGGISLPILLIQLLALCATGYLIKSISVESKYFM
ncbi:23 kDa integral membrane protein-like [Uloborus diversus]|uniref:23 kDa integral membrane protein-like n=1 Tax=Uloborus diversus TaxID=327109 RepID=UPI0024093015|nr:23 kDa integral membrane protein-like [Uloborus diversus]